MGLGRFGVGGCCKCSPDTPTISELAGPCGWCGYYDPLEYNLSYPISEDKLCYSRVEDSFSYSKDYPRVPWWTFQIDTPGNNPAAPWQEEWFWGDYNHLHNGHYLFSSRNRYVPIGAAYWRPHLAGKLADAFVNQPNSVTGRVDCWVQYLINLPPFYGSYNPFSYPYPKRYENGLIINSPTDKTDLIPLKQNMSLEFATPRNQWPSSVWWYQEGFPFACIFEPCTRVWNYTVARQQSTIHQGPVPTYPVFGWNGPGLPPGQSYYGLHVPYFRVYSDAVVPIDVESSSSLIGLRKYIPTQQTVEISYFIGFTGQQSNYEGEGYIRFTVPYMESFSKKIEVQFDNWNPDTRKCLLTVNFYINGNVVFTQQHLIAKPGWRQTGSATDEQAFIQSFCPSRIKGRNDISGANLWAGGVGPFGYYYEIVALWEPNQTPRESFYMDSWQAQYQRL